MTPQERKVMELALEALEEAWYHVGTFQPTEKAIDLYDEARTAIKEALAQTEQEPATKEQIREAMIFNLPLYTTPPQRTWVGLTDEEKKNIFLKWYGKHWAYTEQVQAVMNSVEAKLKELNT